MMRGLPATIIILLLVGGLLAYLLIDKFTPEPEPCATPPTIQSEVPPENDLNSISESQSLKTSTSAGTGDMSGKPQFNPGPNSAETQEVTGQRELASDKLLILLHRMEIMEANLQREQGQLNKDRQKLEAQLVEVEHMLDQLELGEIQINHEMNQIRETRQQLQKLIIGLVILVNLILMAAILFLGLPVLRHRPSQQAQLA
jgi:hypothetical protein